MGTQAQSIVNPSCVIHEYSDVRDRILLTHWRGLWPPLPEPGQVRLTYVAVADLLGAMPVGDDGAKMSAIDALADPG